MAGEPQITIIGHVGKDPEMKITKTGISVASFSVAVTPRKKEGDGWTDGETTWFRISAWHRDGEAAVETLRKGDRVIVQGRFSTSTYDKDGTTMTVNEITSEVIGVIPKPAKPVVKQEVSAPW